MLVCAIAGIHSLVAQTLDATFQLLPQPRQVEVKGGNAFRWHELNYITTTAGTDMPVLGTLLNNLPQARMSGKGITLSLTTENVPESGEGYVLTLTKSGATISSRSQAGLFYGCQTLEQLLEDSRDFNKPIPELIITDYPSVNYRAIHLDTKHHLDRMSYYYEMVDKLARYKVNAIIWELEDKLRFTRRPEVAAPNAISKQEMQALCAYAQARNVEISPLVQGLGHAGFILKHHWELRENPDSDWEFCPAEPKTYEMQFDLYRDALEAMPYGRYLHVGGDEITAIGIDERCKATGKSPFELQMDWLQQVCQFAVDHGREPIFWDDMPLKYAGLWELILGNKSEEEVARIWNTEKLDQAIDLFPKSCVYMRWKYEDATTPAHQRLLKWYHDKGLKVMGATAAASGDSPYMPRRSSRTDYIKGFSELVAENQLEGILATSWDDGSPHLETVWRGYIAQGEFGWNPTARDIEQYKKVHAQREYGFPVASGQMQFLDELEQAFFFFDGALNTSGRRNPSWGVKEFTLIDLPDPANPGAWSKQYEAKINQAREEQARYERIQSGVDAALAHARRNRYTLQIYQQNNQLQNYPTRLLLALHAYDTATDTAGLAAARQAVQAVLDSFIPMRRELETVYGKTRFMVQPEGFIADHNHHNHLAAKTNSSDWLYYYELPMNRKVQNWLRTH